MLWHRRNAEDCAWAEYGDECIVYHRPSGMTHLLNGVSVRLLADFLLEPKDTDEIAGFFMPGNEDVVAEEFRAQFLDVLARLEYFGLVESEFCSRDV